MILKRVNITALLVFQLAVFHLAVFHLAISATVFAAEPRFDDEIFLGRDYFSLGEINTSGQQEPHPIYDIEFFYWLGSKASWEVNQELNAFIQNNANIQNNDKISVRFTPLVPYPSWRPQAYLESVINQLAIQSVEVDRNVLFEQCLKDCQVFNGFESGVEWLRQYLLQNQVELALIEILDKPAIWKAEKNYRNRAKSYSITQVPTIIINGRYKVDAKSAGSAQRMIAIVNRLVEPTLVEKSSKEASSN